MVEKFDRKDACGFPQRARHLDVGLAGGWIAGRVIVRPFEMIRYLTERLPVMICPRWVFASVQPIAIRNVLDYLMAALSSPARA